MRRIVIAIAALLGAGILSQGCASKATSDGPEAKGVKQEKLALPPQATKGR